jgi:hypothetical protein
MTNRVWKTKAEERIKKIIKEKGSYIIAQRLGCVEELMKKAKGNVEHTFRPTLSCPNSLEVQYMYRLLMQIELDNLTGEKAMDVAKENGIMYLIKTIKRD